MESPQLILVSECFSVEACVKFLQRINVSGLRDVPQFFTREMTPITENNNLRILHGTSHLVDVRRVIGNHIEGSFSLLCWPRRLSIGKDT
jgi:hypothetical protein